MFTADQIKALSDTAILLATSSAAMTAMAKAATQNDLGAWIAARTSAFSALPQAVAILRGLESSLGLSLPF